jgi:phenylacetate-CoA ligase
MNWKVLVTGASHLITKRYLGPFWLRHRWLMKTQWMNESALEAIQLKMLKKLVNHCYKTVPYYRRLMQERNITVESIKEIADIKQFPVLRKQDVLASIDDLTSSKYPRWANTMGLTGGTTGTPLSLPRNLMSVENEHAFVRRQWDWAGIRFSDRTAYLSGRVIVDPHKASGRLHTYDPFMRELILSSYHLSADTVPGFVEAMKNYNVRALVGYPSAICFLANVCLMSGLKNKLAAVLTTSEILTDSMRSTISEAFDCKVFDFYGSAERVCYIHTCEHGTYHIIPEYGITELVPVEGLDGNCFKIVATGFWNTAMPLIRYDTGDIVVKADECCACGRAYPTVKSIYGRTGQMLRTPSGRHFGPTLLARIAKAAHNILESQIIQDEIDHIILNYVPKDNFSAADMEEFQRHMVRHFPSDLKIEFKQVDRVERTKSGKANFFISKINPGK